MSDPRDRRKDARADARLQIELGTSDVGGEPVSVSSLNIGAGGVYIEVPRYIEPLTKLFLSMRIPGPTPEEESAHVETEAIVVRTLPEKPQADAKCYEIACAFLDLRDEYRDAINRYILTHRSRTHVS
jgi:hypothetical protein